MSTESSNLAFYSKFLTKLDSTISAIPLIKRRVCELYCVSEEIRGLYTKPLKFELDIIHWQYYLIILSPTNQKIMRQVDNLIFNF